MNISNKTEEDISKGLLRFDKPPIGKAFVFEFPDEKIRTFHTVGMKFPINIYFFNNKWGIILLGNKDNQQLC